jgi:chromosome partitioning protein
VSEIALFKAPLREGPGVRLKMAKDIVGFTDSDKEFRKTALAAGVDPNVIGEEGQRRYLPFEIRKIAQYISSSFAEVKPELYLPALMVFRITKGGTGKTTVCANSAVGLAIQGFRTLVIDADSQGSLSMTLGYDINLGLRLDGDADKTQVGQAAAANVVHLGHLLQRVAKREASGIREAIVPVYPNGMLDLLPANITLANETWMFNVTARESLFQRLLEEEREFFSQYDVILVDCAPGTSLLATTIMAAASAVTAVVTPEPQALVALLGIENNLEEINALLRRNQPPVALHVIMNDYRAALEPHKESALYLKKNYRAFLNRAGFVRSYVGFKREMNVYDIPSSMPLVEKDPNSSGAADVLNVLKELIELYGVKMYAEPVQAAENADEMEEVA